MSTQHLNNALVLVNNDAKCDLSLTPNVLVPEKTNITVSDFTHGTTEFFIAGPSDLIKIRDWLDARITELDLGPE
jgi:hypothetical protein